MPTTSTYLQRIEALFREAEDLFVRIKGGEKCDHIIPDALALDARFDDAGEDLLQGLYKEVEAKIYALPEGDLRKDVAKDCYKFFARMGAVFGPHYWKVDRIVRVCYRNYKDGENELYRGLATKNDYVLDTAEDIHNWIYYYANTISGWWCDQEPDERFGPGWGDFYTPRVGAESIAKYLSKDISPRTYHTLIRVLRPGRPRPQYQWEAIARIIYDCPYFKRTRKSHGQIYTRTFEKWGKKFSQLVGIPPFTQRAGNKQVAEEIERLKKMSGKDGGLKFLLSKPTKKRE